MNKMKKLALLVVTSGTALTLAFMADVKPNKGIDFNSIDTTMSPKDDFYHYANGNWLKNNPIPGDQSRWGSFDVLAEENNKKIRKVVEEVAKDKNAAQGTLHQKLRDFYLLAMDSAKAEQQGISLIKPDLEKIATIKTKKDVAKCMAELSIKGVDNAFGFYVGRDLKNSSAYVLYLSQSGLGLPDRDYYLKDDERNTNYRKAYVEHMTNMLTMINYASPKQTAETILALETELAKVSMSRVEMRDEEKTYNPKTYDELMKLTSSFDWTGYTKACSIPTNGKIIVNQPDYFKSFSGIYDSSSVDAWKAYLTWHYITAYANNLSSAFVNEN
jgi:predicted metalloendopeptidase